MKINCKHCKKRVVDGIQPSGVAPWEYFVYLFGDHAVKAQLGVACLTFALRCPGNDRCAEAPHKSYGEGKTVGVAVADEIRSAEKIAEQVRRREAVSSLGEASSVRKQSERDARHGSTSLPKQQRVKGLNGIPAAVVPQHVRNGACCEMSRYPCTSGAFQLDEQRYFSVDGVKRLAQRWNVLSAFRQTALRKLLCRHLAERAVVTAQTLEGAVVKDDRHTVRAQSDVELGGKTCVNGGCKRRQAVFVAPVAVQGTVRYRRAEQKRHVAPTTRGKY